MFHMRTTHASNRLLIMRPLLHQNHLILIWPLQDQNHLIIAWPLHTWPNFMRSTDACSDLLFSSLLAIS